MTTTPKEAGALTQVHADVRDALPAHLVWHFDALVGAYRYYATVNYKQPFVSYKVLASLVRDGWRCSAPPVE